MSADGASSRDAVTPTAINPKSNSESEDKIPVLLNIVVFCIFHSLLHQITGMCFQSRLVIHKKKEWSMFIVGSQSLSTALGNQQAITQSDVIK